MKQFNLILSILLFLSFTAQLNAGNSSSKTQTTSTSLKKDEKPKIKNRKLRKEVEKWIGTPYKSGGSSTKGTDCSGFVSSVYKKVYDIKLPRTSKGMYKNVKKIGKGRLKEGDLVFFRTSGSKISHVGIYIGDGYFVHASSSRGVVWSNLSEKYYVKTFAKGGRVKK